MKFSETRLAGAWVVEPDPELDERGFFARCFDRLEFERRGLNPVVAQCSISYNERAGTLRGLHLQVHPCAEVKLVRCTAGAIYDVIVDLRDGSPTRLGWHAETLTAANRRLLYVPEGCAHGFLSLEDGSEVLYQISREHSPDHARRLAWNDPALGIAWPRPPAVMSVADREGPFISPRPRPARTSPV